MKYGKINRHILEKIKENCEDNKVMHQFLIELIWQESQHLGQWRPTYNKMIKKYSEKKRGMYED